MLSALTFYLIGTNGLTFLLYGIDKWKPRHTIRMSGPILFDK